MNYIADQKTKKLHDILEETAKYVRLQLKGAEAGHDWWHILRVWNTTKLILQTEPADSLVCQLAALLHDIADSKFYGGDEEIGPRLAGEFLHRINVRPNVVEHVQHIIRHISYKNTLDQEATFHSKELEIVQDADRLDAIGAIGIARAFHYGGFKNREMYNPEIVFQRNMDRESYKQTDAPTLHHFYDKLLLIKDKMNTPTGRSLAESRHRFLKTFLQQFYYEWNGKA